MTVRLVVADDNFLVREGVRRLLEEGPEVETVGTAASAPELLARVAELRPDVVLTDIRMPPSFTTNGIAAARRIRADTRARAWSSSHSTPTRRTPPPCSPTAPPGWPTCSRTGWETARSWCRALTAVPTEGSVVDPSVVDELLASGRRASGSPLRTLSARELDVLREMAQGRTNGAIAARLHVSE